MYILRSVQFTRRLYLTPALAWSTRPEDAWVFASREQGDVVKAGLRAMYCDFNATTDTKTEHWWHARHSLVVPLGDA